MFTVFGCSQAYITLLSIDMWESLCLLSLVVVGAYITLLSIDMWESLCLLSLVVVRPISRY